MIKIIKRNGAEVEFDAQKIVMAISKANDSVNEEARLKKVYIDAIAADIEDTAQNSPYALHVEDIQDAVVFALMKHAPVVAMSYQKYRQTREMIRKANTTDDKIFSLIDLNNEEAKQENSNKNPVINSTQRDYMAGEVSRDLTERILLPQDVVEAHREGIIHFHDSDYFAQREHNCFHKKTKFYTSNGVKSFSDFHDGDKVRVMDKDGIFRDATVRMYGRQPMNEVTFGTNKRTKTVICTSNHRWLLADGSVTTNLKVGDTLIGVDKSEECEPESMREKEMFTLGFLVGDGCDHVSNNTHLIRLCGEKTKYADIIKAAGYMISPIKDSNDLLARKIGTEKQDFLNSGAWRYLDENDKKWLFIGLYKADGANGSNNLTTTDDRVADMVRATSFAAGYYITSETIEKRDTEFKKDSELLRFRFTVRQPANLRWKVRRIKKYHTGADYDAWCVEEPVTHSFILDGGIVTGNCDLVNLEDMLQNGTVISETMIEKPHSFFTACNITTQIIAQVASNQYGGQSFTLSHLVPFVDVSRQKLRQQVLEETRGLNLNDDKINEMTEMRLKREIKSGIQTIQYQLITLMTCNGQAPFVTMFMYLDEVPDGRQREDLAIVIQEVLEQRIQGVKNEKGVWITPAFPKLIYVLDEDNITEGSKYWYLTELAAKCTAKRMVPDYISAKVMRKLKGGNVYTCMGCRSFLTVEENQRNPDGTYKFYGRFNQGVVTINLVDVACSSYGDMDKFWEILDERLELCHKALRCRHERLLGTTSDVAPILWQYGALARLKKGEKIDRLLYNGYSTISLGYAGLYEMCVRMTGKSHTDPEAKPFALAVMQRLNDKCAEWKKAENISYSVYGTPLESTTYKFAKCLQKRFGMIKGVTDKNYITNSYHVHVTEKIDAFTKLSFESEFQKLSPGGAISYVEVPNMQNNIPAVLSVMKFIYENIMYAELNTKSDYCCCCGYDGEIQIVEDDSGKLIWECPNCGNRDQNQMSVARRTCGYIGSQWWNQGRTQEIRDRVLHL